ncbi:unnamed protein product [Dibothriocephalus latus]|uniref:Uncharacterized protein n=1 Tax=Dibothriocephalus latus TaxID=60516 RepID=A0A3P7PU15_DIBLA|nr:unnamed protein product [Dibothriocephalus latus]
MECGLDVGDTRKLYNLIRKVTDKLTSPSDSIRGVNGGLIFYNPTKVERWREHFDHILNFDTQPNTSLLPSTAESFPSYLSSVMRPVF